jgi:hypothetical protein
MTTDKPARIFSRRRLVLLTSAAGIAAIVALGGPTAYDHLSPDIERAGCTPRASHQGLCQSGLR